MGKVISFGIQKGGSGKTTSAGVTAHLLSQDHKVLVIDMDSQGNVTELLTQVDIYDFSGRTVLEALQNETTKGYIHQITENLHIMTADDLLATFSRWSYREYERKTKENPNFLLRKILQEVKDQYDYIIIDTPPALGDQTLNALIASDYAVVMFESSKFCYSALGRYLETINHVQEKANPDLQVAGILRVMIDSRRADNKHLIDLVKEEYPDLTLETVISRKAATGRLSIYGFMENDELKQAVEQYKVFLKELLERVQEPARQA